MSANDLRQKAPADLKTELHELMRERFNLRMQQGSGQQPRPHLFRQVRRNIARVKTILREKASENS